MSPSALSLQIVIITILVLMLIILCRLNLTGGPLRVGGGLVACIREGPGLRTTTGFANDDDKFDADVLNGQAG